MRQRKTVKIRLTPEQERTLTMWASAATSEQRMAQRARVILASAQGKRLPEVSAASRLSPQNCSKWRRRFAEAGLDGLKDAPRSGKPPTVPAETKLAVISLACTKPEDGSNRWSHRKLARRLRVSRGTVQRVLSRADLKPHKIKYWCGKSPDPEFAEKQAAIVGLYLDPPENALVLSVDEKSQIQALDRRQPELPLQPGRPRRQTATYTRHGTTCLLAALAVHEGHVAGRCVDANTHEEFLAFLKSLYRKYPRRELHVILDNLAVHKQHDVREWVGRRRRLHLHFTPTYASWLNQVEIWFGIFTRDVVRGGIWRSKAELVTQIMAYIKHYNATRAKPFKWTYTGEPLVA